MPTPYKTKTGVQIGLLYEPPKNTMSRDDEIIQAALLGLPRQRNVPVVLILLLLLVAYFIAACVWRMK